MVTPYDWQEGIGHRAGYVEARLKHGSPVVAVSRPEGILMLSYRRQSPKIYEIYDRLILSSVGQQSDIESIRVAALEFAHQEGFQRSEQEVTIQRVVSAISGSIKRSFGDFGSTPVIARSLFAEVAATPEEDAFMVLDYDGDYALHRGKAIVSGGDAAGEAVLERLQFASDSSTLDEAVEALDAAWRQLASSDPASETDPADGLTREVILLDRSEARLNRFRDL
ncbi:MAG: 20S proteasome subunit A/B [Fimbriimonas sp.]